MSDTNTPDTAAYETAESTPGQAFAPDAEKPALAPGATNIQVSRGFNAWLRGQRLSIAFTSYQTGQLFLVGGHPNGTVSFNQQNFSRAMGVCWRPGRLYLGSCSSCGGSRICFAPANWGTRRSTR